MTKMLETLGAVYIYIYIYIVIFKNISSKLNIENKAKLIAVFGGRLQPYLCYFFVGQK